ncbi:ubiquilin [Anaeramoeba ignava]|uniref:Ubiquilin n=1 Tax=Anaeramoeba ignava TaxID=1746090 RepID=A0A9Q0LSU2_ANAIG|nr:ubiquilin [Anaeramoeba ignava]
MITIIPLFKFYPIYFIPITNENKREFSFKYIHELLCQQLQKEKEEIFLQPFQNYYDKENLTMEQIKGKIISMRFLHKNKYEVKSEHCLTHEQFPITISNETTTKQMKEKISSQLYIPFDDLRLIHRGRDMEDPKNAENYDIKEDSIIHIVFCYVISQHHIYYYLPSQETMIESYQKYFDKNNQLNFKENEPIILVHEYCFPHSQPNSEHLGVRRGISFYCQCLNEKCSLSGSFFLVNPHLSQVNEPYFVKIKPFEFSSQIECPSCGQHNCQIERIFLQDCWVMWHGYKNKNYTYQNWISVPRDCQHIRDRRLQNNYINTVSDFDNLEQWNNLEIVVSFHLQCSLCFQIYFFQFDRYRSEILTCRKCFRTFDKQCYEDFLQTNSIDPKSQFCPFCRSSVTNDFLNLSQRNAGDLRVLCNDGVELQVHYLLFQARLSLDENLSQKLSKERICSVLGKYNSEFVQRFIGWIYSGYEKREITEETSLGEVFGLFWENRDWEQIYESKSGYNGFVSDLRRLYESDETKDFKIIVEESDFWVHKFVLEARSELFREIRRKAFSVLVKWLYFDLCDEDVCRDVREELEDSQEYFQFSKDPLNGESWSYCGFVSSLSEIKRKIF